MLRRWIYNFRSLRAVIALIKDPRRTEMVFALVDVDRQLTDPIFRATIEKVMAFPGFQGLVQSHYNPALPDLAQLKTYPPGSLGRAFADHISSNHLTIDFYPSERGEHEAAYIVNRARKCHDLWHVLTGFDISVPGEIGLQAFSLAQFRSPLSATLVAGGIMHSLFRNRAIFHDVIDSVFAGYKMGLQSKPLLAEPIEDQLNKNLDLLRQELGIKNDIRAFCP